MRSNQPILNEINPEYWLERVSDETEMPILWPPNGKIRPFGKDIDAGKDWRQEEKGTTEDEMIVWYHQLNGHEFEEAPDVGDRQGSLVGCSPWVHKESDTTEQLNKNIKFLSDRTELSVWFKHITIVNTPQKPKAT